MKKNFLLGLVLIALLLGLGAPANAQTSPAYPEIQFPVDFAAKMARVIYLFENDLSWLGGLLGDDAALIYSFAPDVADANGPWDEEEDLPGPNGMLDAYELGLLAEMANQPGAMQTALIANYHALFTSCWLTGDCPNGVQAVEDEPVYGLHELVNITLPTLWMQLPALIGWNVEEQGPFPSWSSQRPIVNETFQTLALLIAGYATIGDEDTMEVVLKVAGLLGFCDILAPGSCLVQIAPPSTADGYAKNPAILGADGNADGDANTNRTEYNCNGGATGEIEDYVANALDDEIVCDEPTITLDGWKSKFNIGTDISITAMFNGTADSYEWKKEGTVLEDETGATFEILNAQAAQSGNYSVTIYFDDGTKAETDLTKGFVLNIGDYPIPVAGMLGLSLLAGACAVAGVAGIRRRK